MFNDIKPPSWEESCSILDTKPSSLDLPTCLCKQIPLVCDGIVVLPSFAPKSSQDRNYYPDQTGFPWLPPEWPTRQD